MSAEVGGGGGRAVGPGGFGGGHKAVGRGGGIPTFYYGKEGIFGIEFDDTGGYGTFS